MFDIHRIMNSLAQRRPIFHLEADFRLGLASHICNSSAGRIVRVEQKLTSSDEELMDIWFPSEGVVVELVHRLQRVKTTHCGISYDLKSHGALDQGRYDFVKGIEATERAASRFGRVKRGFSVFLTNDPEYWTAPRSGWEETYDADFRIHDKNILSGSLSWDPEASEGTTRGATVPIKLRGSYGLQWRNYSDLNTGQNSQFRYLAVEVGK